ncbi:MAG: hypothetical protein F4Z55_11995 [Boseongicola sp. SB0667_bin_21]|nr:hypothetical protein [Boseongicola sp. SB0667_bin_21]
MKLTRIISAGMMVTLAGHVTADEVIWSLIQSGDNEYSYFSRTRPPYADPQIRFPRNGRHGIYVTYPEHGGEGGIKIIYNFPGGALAQGDGYLSGSRAELYYMIRYFGMQAQKQWTRHLDYDPGTVRVYVGEIGGFRECGAGAAACASEDSGVILKGEFVNSLLTDLAEGNRTLVEQRLLTIFTHEFGHVFGYENPHGITEGCGGYGHKCHDHYGSGSIMSYDHTRGLSRRFYVDEEDISHIPDATWNSSEDGDRYFARKFCDNESCMAESIYHWGAWLRHEFSVSGQTNPQRYAGEPLGNLSVSDRIYSAGFVRGTPSYALPTESASYRGEENFLGVDMGPDFLGALLRADANLQFHFSDQTLDLTVRNFEVYGEMSGFHVTWQEHEITDGVNGFTYPDIGCSNSGCSVEYSSGETIDTKWYANDDGDLTGFVGGVLDDPVRTYVGAFVAEKTDFREPPSEISTFERTGSAHAKGTTSFATANVGDRFPGTFTGVRNLYSFEDWGLWAKQGEETFFKVPISDDDSLFALDDYATSVAGTPTRSNPVSGSAIWIGTVRAYDAHPDTYGTPVTGEARLEVDLSAATIDVALSNFTEGHSDMSWRNLSLHSGAFSSRNDNGTISGAFYGTGHEGVAGEFSRDRLDGVFGALRQ